MSEWVEWKWTPEKPSPVEEGCRVEVEFRTGVKVKTYVPSDAWEQRGDNHDIIAYRVVK